MASSSQGIRVGVQIILGLAIVGLAYWLYVSITEPWQVIEQQEEMTQMTRERMSDVRAALRRYEDRNDRFPSTLDSLHLWVRTDSTIQAQRDSLFGVDAELDSLIFSPRTGTEFEYAVNDTAQVMMYELRDPDSNDRIGTLQPDPTELNAATWE
jgi:type II secretory pathway pseudopilin PulG